MLVKLACIVASPEVRMTVVEAEVALAMVAVPLVTVQLTKEYPEFGEAVMVVAAPWPTVTGEVDGSVIVPPVPPAFTKSW